MNIVWCLPTFDHPKTGGEKAIKRLAELLESKGVTLVKGYKEYMNKSGILRKIIINLRNFKILVNQDRNALIIQNLFNPSEFFLSNLVLFFLFRRKIVLFIHEVYEVDHLPVVQKCYYSLINYLAFKTASLIVVNSIYTGNWVCSFGDLKRKTFLMYPIVKRIVADSAKPKKITGDTLKVLCVGNIRRNKGQLYLLHALKGMPENVKSTFAGLVKEKDYMEMLNKFIEETGISDKVHFAGFLNEFELAEEYQEADIFVLPTLKEGFGLSIWEAMSYGLPVVAIKIGGVVEQVTDGVEGFLVPPGEPKALGEKLNKLIVDPVLRIRMGEFGRQRAAKFPIMDQVFDKFYQVVAKI